MTEPALSHKNRVWQIEERRHANPDEFVGRMRRTERLDEHLDCVRIAVRQKASERPCYVPAAIKELEILQANGGCFDERTRVEIRMHPFNVAGQSPNERRREERLELVSQALSVRPFDGEANDVLDVVLVQHYGIHFVAANDKWQVRRG